MAAGLRRRVLVVDAYRSLEADSATHVEAVGRAAAQLPHGAACAFGSDSANVSAADGDAGEGGSSDEGRAAAKALAECAARIAERCAEAGVLHLAMHGSTDGLVSSWRTQVVAVAEPSAELVMPSAAYCSAREISKTCQQFCVCVLLLRTRRSSHAASAGPVTSRCPSLVQWHSGDV